jgi:hypothetical protein
VTDPVHAVPKEAPLAAEASPEGVTLLARRDFRRLYIAVCVSELGDAFHYVALMWTALVAGGPLGVVAVRLADSIPALVFGLHGGLVADRVDRRRTMVLADVARAVVLVPLAALGLAGRLDLWVLVPTAFLLEAATSYFAPAYGALLPSLVERRNVQTANGLVRATTDALSVAGWAAAAGLLAFLPLSAFFALNAASFLISALLLRGIAGSAGGGAAGEQPRIRAGFAALKPHPDLGAAVIVLGIAVTMTAGTWIAGVPELVRTTLGRGAGAFSLLMVGYAIGSIAAGAALVRRPVRRKSRASMIAWCGYLPAYLLLAFAGSLPVAFVGALVAGISQSTAVVLLNSAAQGEIPDALLGRVMGLISLTHRGAHATGLLFVSPLFALVAPRSVFTAAACSLPLLGLAGAALGGRASRRASAARAPG